MSLTLIIDVFSIHFTTTECFMFQKLEIQNIKSSLCSENLERIPRGNNRLINGDGGVQSPSHVRLFATPWTAAHQALLSSAISWSLLKFMSVESVMLSNYLILCHLLLLLPSVFPTFRVLSSELAGLPQVAKVFGASASDLPVNTQGWFCYL